MATKKKSGNVVKMPERKTEQTEKQPVQSLDSIAKVKFDLKNSIPEIACYTENKRYSKTSNIKGREEAKDEFISSLQALKPFFCSICEIEHKIDDTKIYGISFDETGIVISAQIHLTEYDIDSPWVTNSPHIFYENKTGGFEVPEDVTELLNTIKKRAIEYLQGDYKYNQQNIFASANLEGVTVASNTSNVISSNGTLGVTNSTVNAGVNNNGTMNLNGTNQIAKNYQTKLMAIDKSITETIVNNAKTNGYDLVLSKQGAVLYGGIDITKDLMKSVK